MALLSDKRAADAKRVGEKRDDPMPLGGASRAMDESVDAGDANELATIRVRTMYGCVCQHASCPRQ